MEEIIESSPPKIVRAHLKHFQKYIENVRRFKNEGDKRKQSLPLELVCAVQDADQESSSFRKSEITDSIKNSSIIDSPTRTITLQIETKNALFASSQSSNFLATIETIIEKSAVEVKNVPSVLHQGTVPFAKNQLNNASPVLPQSTISPTRTPFDNIQFAPAIIQLDKDKWLNVKNNSEIEDVLENLSCSDEKSEMTRSSCTEESLSDEDNDNEINTSAEESLLHCGSNDSSSDVSDLDELISTESSESSDSEIFEDEYYSREDSFDSEDDDAYLDRCY
jgi:hypothetical protein